MSSPTVASEAVSAAPPSATNPETEGGEIATVEEEAAPAKPQPKLCGVCDKDEGKYKCPRPGCQLP